MKTSTVHFYLLGLTYLFFYVPTVAFSNDYSNKATYFFDDSILNYSDTQLPILDDSELFDRNCDTIQVHIRNNELIVDNLVRPNTHVKIFDKDYNLVFECLGDCGTSIIFPNLNSGEIYRTNIQVYDENWRLVCEDMKEVVLEGTNEPCPSSDCQDLISLCESIAINTEDNRIILSNLATVPNKVIKVFDEDYNIVYQCASNCVEKQQLVSAFSNGTYIVDIQLYDENWENICSERRTINLENDGEPCDTSICTGDIIINTQAEIDAFCGCEVIKGNLLIGDRLGEVRDIFSLANFSGLKRIEGIFSVGQTQIEDFTGLEELTFIGGGFAALFNPNLTSFKGLEKVQRIPENIAIFNNVALKDVSNFESLTEVGVQIIIEDNDNLTKVEGFSNLTSIGNNINSMSIRAISISRNTQLKTINAFQNVQTLENLFVSVNINLEHFAGFDNLREIGTLGINNNNRLRQIDFGDNLQSILTNIIVENNSLLEDCCVFQDLLDSDAENGQILGDINISQNFRGCNSSNDILQRCETTTTATCE